MPGGSNKLWINERITLIIRYYRLWLDNNVILFTVYTCRRRIDRINKRRMINESAFQEERPRSRLRGTIAISNVNFVMRKTF